MAGPHDSIVTCAVSKACQVHNRRSVTQPDIRVSTESRPCHHLFLWVRPRFGWHCCLLKLRDRKMSLKQWQNIGIGRPLVFMGSFAFQFGWFVLSPRDSRLSMAEASAMGYVGAVWMFSSVEVVWVGRNNPVELPGILCNRMHWLSSRCLQRSVGRKTIFGCAKVSGWRSCRLQKSHTTKPKKVQ